MPSERRRLLVSWVALVLVGLAAAGVWRAEVEYHGWEGLIWTSYFHWSLPVGVGMFIAWVLIVNRRLSAARIVLLGLGLFVVTVLFYGAVGQSFLILYPRFPMVIFYYAEFTRWGFILQQVLDHEASRMIVAGSWVPLAPLAYFGLGWLVGIRPGWHRFLVAESIFLAGVPCSIAVLIMTRPLEADLIHTIKTGIVIPFLVVGLGALFLPGGRRGVQEALVEGQGVPCGLEGVGE